ncbi:MAG: glycolate oxidase subunit GlcE [Nitrosomonadales bacterium]|jgi:glycolate oxidase FAD binding subunit|nr:MAG: glycolate oxidase subunit GlcE [Nitrosomonadales bacterium]
MQDIINQYTNTIRVAAKCKSPLRIRGGGSKDFYGNNINENNCDILSVTAYTGIVDYDPTELVVTARSGTSLADLEAELQMHNQMLGFEPPHFGSDATLGGCVASGLSGPRRAYVGAVRDFVLGVRMLDGNGNDLHFGGQVMKNVAGYDISRLMTGSMGTLGLLLEISIKVLPIPPIELTLRMQMKEATAIEKMNQWAGRPLPISATCFYDNNLTLRLSGAESAVRAAHTKLGGELISDGLAFWNSIREQSHTFFQSGKSLWRLSIKSSVPPLILPGQQLIEWGGALRWFACGENVDADVNIIRSKSDLAGGNATLFRNNKKSVSVFHPPRSEMIKVYQRIKGKFDPAGIFNTGRMYREL